MRRDSEADLGGYGSLRQPDFARSIWDFGIIEPRRATDSAQSTINPINIGNGRYDNGNDRKREGDGEGDEERG